MLLYNAERMLRRENEERMKELLPEHRELLEDMQIYLLQQKIDLYERAAILKQFIEMSEQARERKDTLAHVAGGDCKKLCDEYIAIATKEGKQHYITELMTVFSVATFVMLTMTFVMNTLIGLLRYGTDGFSMDIPVNATMLLSVVAIVALVMLMVRYSKNKLLKSEQEKLFPIGIFSAFILGVVVVCGSLLLQDVILLYANYAILAMSMATLYLFAEFLNARQENRVAAHSKIG